MASKFQNRLVGTIVLVALGVIVLPGLLDGQKKHYQDEFAAIPLVPKPGDRDEPDMMPAATQALPTQPPEGAAEEVRAGDAAAPSLDPSRLTTANSVELDPVPAPVEPPKPNPKPQPVAVAPTPAPTPAPKPAAAAAQRLPTRHAAPCRCHTRWRPGTRGVACLGQAARHRHNDETLHVRQRLVLR